MIILTAPGNFYNRDRYFNEVIGDGDRDLIDEVQDENPLQMLRDAVIKRKKFQEK